MAMSIVLMVFSQSIRKGFKKYSSLYWYKISIIFIEP